MKIIYVSSSPYLHTSDETAKVPTVVVANHKRRLLLCIRATSSLNMCA